MDISQVYRRTGTDENQWMTFTSYLSLHVLQRVCPEVESEKFDISKFGISNFLRNSNKRIYATVILHYNNLNSIFLIIISWSIMYKSWCASHSILGLRFYSRKSAYISLALHYLLRFPPWDLTLKASPAIKIQSLRAWAQSYTRFTYQYPFSWNLLDGAITVPRLTRLSREEILEENRAASIRPPHPPRYPSWINLELTQIADANRQALNYRQNRACRRDPPVTPRPF